MPTETETVNCAFVFTKVSYYCIDDGGMHHQRCSSTTRVEMPPEVETLEDAIRWLDKARKDADRWTCKSCGSGGMVWHSLQVMAKAVIILDYSSAEIVAARQNL